MPTPLDKLGTLRPLSTGWEALIRIDKGKRRGFALTSIAPTDEAAARERCNEMGRIALRVRQAGRVDKLPKLLELAAVARAGKAWDAILAAADRLCAGTIEPLSEAARVTVHEFGKQWQTGDLHRRYPDHVKLKNAKRDKELARIYVDPVIGERRIAELELDDCDEVMSQIVERHAIAHRERLEARTKPIDGRPKAVSLPPPPSPATRRHVAQYLRRLLGYAAYPARLREMSPIPKGWLPRLKDGKAKECLYPDEDRALLACEDIPLVRRLAYGFLAREGMRTDELARLQWRDVDLVRGRVDLDANKTDDPRAWDLDPGVARALARWRKVFVPNADALEPVFAHQSVPLSVTRLAPQLRTDLVRAGVTREKLFERSESRQPIRAHDLRATFITISLATGRTETWVSDRTGHTSSVMINRYRRRARTWKLGILDSLDKAIPELADRTASPQLDDHPGSQQTAGEALTPGARPELPRGDAVGEGLHVLEEHRGPADLGEGLHVLEERRGDAVGEGLEDRPTARAAVHIRKRAPRRRSPSQSHGAVEGARADHERIMTVATWAIPGDSGLDSPSFSSMVTPASASEGIQNPPR